MTIYASTSQRPCFLYQRECDIRFLHQRYNSQSWRVSRAISAPEYGITRYAGRDFWHNHERAEHKLSYSICYPEIRVLGKARDFRLTPRQLRSLYFRQGSRQPQWGCFHISPSLSMNWNQQPIFNGHKGWYPGRSPMNLNSSSGYRPHSHPRLMPLVAMPYLPPSRSP